MRVSSQQLERTQWRQFGAITAAAIGIYAGLRLLPTGTNLSHMDFRVDPKVGNAIEFCDPSNPQFIPVVAARSPVSLAIRSKDDASTRVAGKEVHAVIALHTGSGKPVAPEDLLVTHTRRLHLLVVDPTLTDYQHVHPEPAQQPGDWSFAFAPKVAGTYRIFADFTPAATSRGLYASADLEIAGAAGAVGETNDAATRGASGDRVNRDGYEFGLSLAESPARAGKPIDLCFTVSRADGGAVPLQPVMGAFAHLVAFDETRSGFAHLHPMEADLTRASDAVRPALNFKLTIPRAGRYVVWAQVNLAGDETFVPFAIDVAE